MTARHQVAIAILSLALIAFQLVLMQILSIVQWYHFAFMIISVALLGFGASGTLLSIMRNRLLPHAEVLAPGLMILSGLAMAVVVPLCQIGPVRFDSLRVFVETGQLLSLLLTHLLVFLPFFLGALSIGLMFVRYVDRISQLYFANLVGSGAGGLFALSLMWVIMPAHLPPIVALLPVAAGLVILPTRRRSVLFVIAAMAAGTMVVMFLFPPRLVSSEYKSVTRTLNLPDARIVTTRPGPHGLVQVVSSPALRYGPGLSLTYTGEVPVTQVVFNNGDWFGPIMGRSRGHPAHLLDYTTMALPYVLQSRENVVVLHAGTGAYVSQALANGASHVTALEPHSAVIDVMKRELAEATDSLWFRPEVELHTIDPRTFLMSDTSLYDAIIIPPLDAFGGTVGLFAMREQYALTAEAMLDVWNRLSPEGVLTISSWIDQPLRSPLRSLTTLTELLEEVGVSDPRIHLAAARSWATVTYILKRTPISAGEAQRIRQFCDRMMFDPLILPDLRSEEQERFNKGDDRFLFAAVDSILSPSREEFIRKYEFNITPATDDRPYYSQFLKLASLPVLRNEFGDQALPFLEIGYVIVVVTLMVVTVLAGLLILAPLFMVRLRSAGRMWVFVYFSGLGLGYMFIEMVFIQRFVLFYGHPLYAAAAVICIMLICSGVGSYTSSYISLHPKMLVRLLVVVTMLLVAYGLVLPPLLHVTAHAGMAIKLGLSFLIIAPVAFLMGMPFPLGLRSAAVQNDSLVPWAWGMNGSVSVASTALATVLAVETGFFVVTLIAAAAYAMAAASCVARRLPGNP